MMLAPAAWLVLAAVDCSNIPPAPQEDEVAARAYLEVARDELDRGELETGAAALREALRLDPHNAAARARWVRLCAPARDAGHDEVLARAARAVEAERYGEAAADLRPLANESAPQAALLYGIALYELGDDEGAGRALTWAEATPETAETAALFQGLLALRAGDSERAASLFDRVGPGATNDLARTSLELSRLARRDFRIGLTAAGEAGYDSNVDQAPDNSPAEGFSSDAVFGISGLALYRPLGERGPYLQAGGRYRNLLAVSDYDLGSLGGAVGWTFAAGSADLSAEYGFDALWLAASPLLLAHQFRGSASAPAWGLVWTAALAGRLESYRTVATADFSGPAGDAEVAARFRVPGNGLVRVRYRGEVHASREPQVAWTDHGGGARGVFPIWQHRVIADGELTFRRYWEAEPGFGGRVRQDRYVDLALALEHDVDREITIRFAASWRRAFSNVTSLDYTRFAATMGVLYTTGLF